MKDLGKVGRKKESLIHWEMESRRGYNKLINGYGISKGKSNLATGSFGFVNEMDINDLEKRSLIPNKGNSKAQLEQLRVI